MASVTTTLAAQQSTVTLHVLVTDRATGLPMTAHVELRSREPGVVRQIQTDARSGLYRAMGLQSGKYDVTARAIGYRSVRHEGIRLVLGELATVHLALERGVMELTPVVVPAERSESGRADISTAVRQEDIEQLPLNSRNVLNLAALAPGIRTYAPEAGRSLPSSGALVAPRFVNLYVDGVEWKGMALGALVGQAQTGSLIPQDAIREFRVYLNPYDVEFTRGAAWVISAVTHSGSNDLEGSVFAFHQDRNLVARGTFQTGKPDYMRVQAGGSLRGPIIRDRLFFDASYEGQVTDEFPTVVPGRPAENPAIWDEYAGTFRAPFRNHAGVFRLTAPRGAHTFDASVNARRLRSTSAFGVLSNNVMASYDAAITSAYDVVSVQLRDSYVSSSLVNELTLHLLEQRQGDEAKAPGPSLRYPGILIGRSTLPQQIDERHVRLTNKLSRQMSGIGGEHVLKAGLELTRIEATGYQPTNRDGLFLFARDTSSRPSSGQIGIGAMDSTSTSDARATMRGWLTGVYVQDEWRPVPRVTLTAGLRYDAEIGTLDQDEVAPWASDTVLQRVVGDRYLNSGDRRNDLDNIAPRISGLWDIRGNGRATLRAGYGVMYDRVPMFGAFFERIAWRWRTYTVPNPGTTDPGELRTIARSGGGTQVPPNIVLLPDRLEAPASRQWSMGGTRWVGEHLALDMDYSDKRTSNLPVTVRVNLRNASGQRPLTSRYGGITLWGDFGDARFRAVLTTLRYERARTRVSAAYTLGWARSDFRALSTSDLPDSSSYRMQQSEGDERHRVVVVATTTLPFSIQLSTITIAASPRPFLVAGSDVNQNLLQDDDAADGTRTHRPRGWEHWYRTIDVRLARAVAVKGGHLTITAEAFNVLNTSNHAEYRSAAGTSDFGEPIGDYARRQVQLGIRFSSR